MPYVDSNPGAYDPLEILTAAQMEIVRSNQAHFNDAIGNIWWEELGRTTLGSAGDTISVSGFAAKRHLKILLVGTAEISGLDSGISFNGDTGTNYAYRLYANVATPLLIVDTTSLPIESGNVPAGGSIMSTLEFFNPDNGNKVGFGHTISEDIAATASVLPRTLEHFFKWDNNAQVTTVSWNAPPGTFAAGSEVIVLGHD